jgi:signal peptidase I
MSAIRIPAQRTPPDSSPAPAADEPQVAELGWLPLLRRTVARAALAMVASLVLWSLLPALMGWAPRVILSGSMEPRIHSGDVIVTREVAAATLTKGQVITVTDPDHPEKTRTHRLVRRDADGTLVTKGDANQDADSSQVTDADVLGLGVIRVPFVGRPSYWMAERNWPALGVSLLLLGWCAVSAFPGRTKPSDVDEDDRDEAGPTSGAGTRSTPATSPTRGSHGRRVAAAVTVGLVAVGALGSPADAAFKRMAGNTVSTLNAASTFYPYNASVLADSPSFYWRFNEASGTAIDDATSAGRDGTLLAQAASLGQTGALVSEPKNKSLSVTMGVVNANTSGSAPGAFTVEAWVKTTSTSGGRILGFGNGTGMEPSTTVDRQLYLAPTGKAMFGVGASKTAIASTSNVNNGAWHHVVGAYATGRDGMKLYVDGVLQGTATATAVSVSGIWRAGAEQLSNWPGNPTDYFFEGGLDELAVYPRSLTGAEVQEHYKAGVTA